MNEHQNSIKDNLRKSMTNPLSTALELELNMRVGGVDTLYTDSITKLRLTIEDYLVGKIGLVDLIPNMVNCYKSMLNYMVDPSENMNTNWINSWDALLIDFQDIFVNMS